ncbi:hypothetical protein EBX93_17210, partial [bacterium]|nr:hypothetical protein [bacterium]
DLSLKTTLAELYEKTQIETHYYTTELNRFELVDLSYKTHPDWTVADAVRVSCTLPMVFDPMIHEGKCYVDGGLLSNYPVEQCAKDWPEDLDEILGVSLGNPPPDSVGPIVTEESGFLDMMSVFFGKMVQRKLFGAHNHSVIQNNIMMVSTPMTFEYMYEMAQSQEMRQALIDDGVAAFTRQFSLVSVEDGNSTSKQCGTTECSRECSNECSNECGEHGDECIEPV